MNHYRNTSPDWGANTQATLEDYQTLAKRYQEDGTEEVLAEVKPELLTADEKHVYYDGKPIADRIAGPDEWQCNRCGDVVGEVFAKVDGGYLCKECDLTISDDTVAKLDLLSDDTLTEKVAEAVGAVWRSNCGANRWHWPNGTITNDCPDYARDLNAMHEAEFSLSDRKYLEYVENLGVITLLPRIVSATAKERAKAFIITMEDKP
jgi:hypothetical protein